MRRDEVLDVCRAVSGQLGVVQLLALGSQAIHVLVEPEDVPEQLTTSVELDVVVLDTLPRSARPGPGDRRCDRGGLGLPRHAWLLPRRDDAR